MLLQNCKALQGPRYTVHRSHLFIHNLGPDDEGDYTCRFTHNENGVHYNVTATMSLVVKGELGPATQSDTGTKMALSALPQALRPVSPDHRDIC